MKKMTVRNIEIILMMNLMLWCVEGDSPKEWKRIENPCLCKEFRCTNGTFCLPSELVCNGSKDCPNGEDERIEIKGVSNKCKRGFKANCMMDEFKCKFGDCIKLTQVCDGIIDCWGGVDEAIDFCTWVYSKK